MVFMPPQNGKSELVSRRFPAYAFGRKPDKRIIECTYAAELSQAMSRDVQAIMMSPEYHQLFPGTKLAQASDPEKRTQGEFGIVGHRGLYVAAGVGGPIGGRTADISILDDPIKNRKDADSELMRDNLWEWYTSTFTTRQFGNTGSIILCQTRWHEDDLAGRLLRLAKENPDADQWEVISMPAIAEVNTRYRKAGEALWSAKYPLSELKSRRASGGEYDWASLYQQAPVPSGGGLFKEEWFANRFVDVPPALMRTVRGWDTASTEEGGDWTAGVKIGEEFEHRPDERGVDQLVSTGRFFVCDVVHKQLGPDGVDKLMKVTAELDGAKCAQREEKEGGSAGVAVIAARKKSMRGIDYNEVIVTGSKTVRSKPFRQQCEAGNVYLVRGAWNAKYVSELTGFPTAKHDDQVDGSSCAFNAVLMEPVPEEEFVSW